MNRFLRTSFSFCSSVYSFIICTVKLFIKFFLKPLFLLKKKFWTNDDLYVRCWACLLELQLLAVRSGELNLSFLFSIDVYAVIRSNDKWNPSTSQAYYICILYTDHACLYNKTRHACINMFPIAGQTAGPIGLQFFVDTHGWPGGSYWLKNRFLKKYFFYS